MMQGYTTGDEIFTIAMAVLILAVIVALFVDMNGKDDD